MRLHYFFIFILLPVFYKTQSVSFTQAPGSPISITNSMRGAICKDINSDGKTDILVTSANSALVYVFLGQGNGQFNPAPGSPITVNSGPIYITLADFNGDGKMDMATANYYSGNMSIFLGSGTGLFTPIQGSPFSTGSLPYCIDVSDFNMDGSVDLITCNAGSNNVMIFLGNGNGSFNMSQPIIVGAGGMPYHVISGHFNADNFPDFATANGTGNSVSVFLGNGTGGFMAAPGSPVSVGAQPRTISSQDLNSDGRPDLVVANLVSNNVSILLGTSSGLFSNAPGSPVIVGAHPYQSVISDFNSNGVPDIAVTNDQGNNISILSGNGNGTFLNALGSPINVGNSPQPICTGDFNGDGLSDIGLGEWGGNKLSILLNTNACAHADVSSSIATSSNLCQGLTVQFLNSSVNAGAFHWDFGNPATLTDTSNNASPVYTFPGYGTYTITLTSTAESNPACKSTTQKIIKINPLLSPTLQPVYSACYKNNQFSFNVGGSVHSSAIYSWSTSSYSHSALNANPLSASFNSPSTQTISVNISQFGCQASLSTSVLFINPIAKVNEEALNCNEKKLSFINLSTDATSYYWDFGIASSTSTLVSPVFTYPVYGVYTITLIASSGSCKDTLREAIRVFQKLLLLPNPAQNPQCLKSNNFSFPANGIYSAAAAFNWLLSNASDSIRINTENISNIHLLHSGTYSVTLSITENGCTRKRTELIEIKPQPGTNYTLSANAACQPAAIFFHYLADPGQKLSYLWTIDTSNFTVPELSYTFTNPGVYSYSLIVKNEFNCADTLIKPKEIQIYESPQAKILVDPLYTNLLDPEITFIDSTLLDHTTRFDFGDGENSGLTRVSHKYHMPGIFPYVLEVKNKYGCSDTLLGIVVIDEINKDLIPNIFTPNHDGVNELFLIKGDNITGSRIWIYDRWDNLVFSSNDAKAGWDGVHAITGRACADGTYLYLIEMTLDGSRDYTFRGTVHLQR